MLQYMARCPTQRAPGFLLGYSSRMAGSLTSSVVGKLPLMLALAGAGGLGTLARFAVSSWVARLHHESAVIAPLGTLVVNALGCFLFGLVWAWAASRADAPVELRLIVLTGFLGAFTTFSTFGFETMHLLRTGAWMWAAGYLIAQCVTGVLLAFAGYALGTR